MGNKLCGDRPDLGSDVNFRTSPNSNKNLHLVIEEKEVEKVNNLTEPNFPGLSSQDVDQAKVALIQNEWRKKKEQQNILERLKVLEKDLANLGKNITVEEMKSKMKPEILKVQKNLPVYEGTPQDQKKLEGNLVLRRPFLFNYDNSIYHGFWGQTGLREGYGVQVKPNGTVQEGLWWEGRLVKGRVFDAEGNYYEGDIQDELPHGVGAKHGIDGSLFTGQWKNGKQFLLGERIYENKSKYQGMLSESLFNGKGKFTWPDGSTFDGEFSKSSIKGFGKYKHIEGDTFEGTWNNNYPNGKGTYIFSGINTGHKYEGEHLNGKREGTGKYIFGPDTYYSGQWSNGYPHGKGEYKIDSNTYKGFWRYGKLINLDEGKSMKNLEITVSPAKEKFKMIDENFHLRDDVHGKITKNTKNCVKSYRPSLGSDVLSNIVKQF
jgi:hypothetical protein